MRFPLEPDRARLRTDAVRGVGWTAALKVGTQLGSLVTFVVLARLLTPKDFGLVALAGVVVMLVTLLFDLSVGHYLVQQEELKRVTVDTVFWTALLLGVLVAVVVAASAPLASTLLDEPQLGGVLVALALTVPISSLSAVPYALLRRSLAFDVLTRRGLISVVTSSVVGVSLAFAGFGVWALVAQAYVLPLVSLVLFYAVARWRPRFSWNKRESVRILRYGVALWGMSSLQLLRTRGDDLIVGAVLGSSALGIYSVAKRMVMQVSDLFAGVALQVLPPVLAAAKGDPARVRRGYLTAVAATSAVLVPVTFWLAAMSGLLVPLVFGQKWEDAAPIAQITALGAAITVLSFLDRGLFLALNLPTVEVRASAVATALVLVPMALAASFGLTALAVTGSAMGYVAWTWRLLVVHRRATIPARMVLKTVAPIWLAACTSAGAGYAVLVLTNEWQRPYALMLAALLGVVTYPPLLRVLAPTTVAALRTLVPARLCRRGLARLACRFLLGGTTPAP